MDESLTPSDPVVITIGGRDREMRLSMAACRRIKARLGVSVLSADTLRSLDEDLIPALIFEAITAATRGELTEDDVAEEIDFGGIKTAVIKLTAAMNGSAFEKKQSPASRAQMPADPMPIAPPST